MKLLSTILVAMVLSTQSYANDSTAAPHAEQLGWRFGVQAFSFYTGTFSEAVDHVAALNLCYIEAMPFGRLSAELPGVSTNHRMSPEHRALMRKKLDDSNVTLSSYGVVELPNDEKECRQVFEFAKEMGVETIVSEPPPEALDLIEKLCDEYGINMAIHNHPIPSAYWNPRTVLAAVEGRSSRMGACVDTSHWMRSGVDVVEALKLLEGRIITSHFGEVSGMEMEAFAKKREGLELDDRAFPSMIQHVQGIPNVVYGTGPADMRSWLHELVSLKVKGVFSVEAFFELSPAQAVEKIRDSIAYLDAEAEKILESQGK